MTAYGRLEVPKSHILSPQGSFSQSPYLKELALYVGQELTFSDAEAFLKKLSHIDLGAKQIERICHHYGQVIEDSDPLEMALPDSSQEAHYVMMDGSMVLSRESGWTEAKLARIFSSGSVVGVGKTRKWVRQSQYMAHIGCSTDFIEKLEGLLLHYPEKVFIADGARWIWKYIEDQYPDSVQILDYYHALEYLHDFAKDHWPRKASREEFISTCTAMLDQDRVAEVIDKVKQIEPLEASEESRGKLLSYYQNNQHRMSYHTFRKQGYAIGSGAMESAHRTVIQERVRRSGQRWTKEGVQQVVNLRVAHQSNQWPSIINMLRNAA